MYSLLQKKKKNKKSLAEHHSGTAQSREIRDGELCVEWDFSSLSDKPIGPLDSGFF
jgi:hypothetical protein